MIITRHPKPDGTTEYLAVEQINDKPYHYWEDTNQHTGPAADAFEKTFATRAQVAFRKVAAGIEYEKKEFNN